MYDFPTNPVFGTVVNVPDGSYRVWDTHKWTAAPSSNSVLPGVGYLPLTGGVMTAGMTPLLTLHTSDNGPTCNNGLEVIQGYNGGGLGIGVGVTGYTASFQYGTETFHDHFAMIFNTNPGFRPNGQYNNLESVLTIPAGTTNSNLTNAFTASVHDYSGHGALAATFYAMAGVSNSTVWSQNAVCTDRNSTHPYPAPLTNVRMQIENDFFVSDPSNTVRGTLNVLSAVNTYASPMVPLVSPTAENWIAFSAGIFSANPAIGLPQSAPWDIGFSSGNGGARVALVAGVKDHFGNPTTTGNISQPVTWNYTDNVTATTQRTVSVYADPTYAGLTGVDLRFDSNYAGRANITLDNLAYIKACNSDVDAAGPNPATLALMGLNGQNQLSIGDGVLTTLIRGNNGGLCSIAQFNAAPNAVNNVQFTGGVAGSPPTIQSFHGQLGTDTNIGLNVNAFGTGTLALQTTGGPTTVGGPLNYTATGGTVSRSAQDRAGEFLTVEDFGAKGDGTVDDSNAFDAYAAYLRAQIALGKPQNAWVLGFGRSYYVTRSIDCTGFSHFRFEGNHSRIVSVDLTHPALDFLNASYCTIANIRLACGSQASPGLLGIAYGMAHPTPNAPSMTFDSVKVDGYFTAGCMLNADSESNLLTGVTLVNRYTSGTAGSSYCFLADGMGFWDLNSRYVTDTRTPRNQASSFIGLEIVGCTFEQVGNGSVIWEGGGGAGHHYRGGYMHNTATVPIVKLVTATDPGGLFGYNFTDFIWDVHAEFNPSCTFLISGNQSLVHLTGWKVRDHNVMLDVAGFMFKADVGITQVWLDDAELMIPRFWRAGSKLFDQPSLYILNGRVMMRNASISAWTPPPYGYVYFMTDTSRASVTMNTYGIVSDVNGADISAATIWSPSIMASGNLWLNSAKTVSAFYDGAGKIQFNIGGNAAEILAGGGLNIFGTKVIGTQIGGWGTSTGGVRGAITGSSTLPQVAAALAQLLTDLKTHGMIGA